MYLSHANLKYARYNRNRTSIALPFAPIWLLSTKVKWKTQMILTTLRPMGNIANNLTTTTAKASAANSHPVLLLLLPKEHSLPVPASSKYTVDYFSRTMGALPPPSATIIRPTPTSTIITETLMRTQSIVQRIIMVLTVCYHSTYLGVHSDSQLDDDRTHRSASYNTDVNGHQAGPRCTSILLHR